jgi:ankyrin repeat protein
MRKKDDIEAKFHEKETPILQTIKHDLTSLPLDERVSHIARLVTSKNSNINAKDKDGNTALHQAVLSNQLNTLKVLFLDESIDIDSQNELGQTALHLAVMKGYKEITEYLILKNPDLLITDKEGNNAAQLAFDYKKHASADLLFMLTTTACIQIQTQQDDLSWSERTRRWSSLNTVSDKERDDFGV